MPSEIRRRQLHKAPTQWNLRSPRQHLEAFWTNCRMPSEIERRKQIRKAPAQRNPGNPRQHSEAFWMNCRMPSGIEGRKRNDVKAGIPLVSDRSSPDQSENDLRHTEDSGAPLRRWSGARGDAIRRNQHKPSHPYWFCFLENACVLSSAHAFSVLITAPAAPHIAPKKAAYEPA